MVPCVSATLPLKVAICFASSTVTRSASRWIGFVAVRFFPVSRNRSEQRAEERRTERGGGGGIYRAPRTPRSKVLLTRPCSLRTRVSLFNSKPDAVTTPVASRIVTGLSVFAMLASGITCR